MARELSGKTERAVANGIGLDLPSYYDLETHDDELELCLSLGELSKLCGFLGIVPAWLFSGNERVDPPIVSLAQLADQLQSHVAHLKTTVSEFEHGIGWAVGPFLVDWRDALTWNVDCLRSVCSAVGVNWLAALPRD
jgi:hypothetical protein